MPSRKGKPNTAKVAFRERLERYCTRKRVGPHYWMVQLLADTSTTLERVETDADGVVHHFHTPSVPLALQLTAAMELAQYLQPKLRSIVVAGDPESPLTLLHAMPQGQFDVLLQRRLLDAGYGRLAPVSLLEEVLHRRPRPPSPSWVEGPVLRGKAAVQGVCSLLHKCSFVSSRPWRGP